MQDAVNAVTDAQVILQRLDVNIRGAFLQRRTHDLVDEADHGGLRIFLVEDVDLLLQIEGGIIHIAALQDGLEGFRADAITGTESRQNGPSRRHAPSDRLLDFLGDDLPGGKIERVVGQQIEVVVVKPDRIGLVTKSEPRRKLLAQLVVHGRQRVFPERESVFRTDFPQEFVFGDEALFEQCANG